jgi:dolichol kinase
MAKSLRKEIMRKLFHLMELPVLLAYSLARHFWTERVAILALTALFLLLLEIEHIRLETRFRLPKHINIFRGRENDNVAGSIFFIAATIIVFSVFDYPIAVLDLLLTVFGDFMSALVGIKFGKRKLFRQQTLEGFLAGLVINLVVGFVILPDYPAIYIIMAFVASFVELVTTKLDDNLTVPLFAGFTGQIIAYSIGANLPLFPGIFAGLLKFLP